jgi:carbon monoxide dehydrogenase subunit G
LPALFGRRAMNFKNTFTVAVPPAEVWEAMMDFERVAPCMPGAEVTERTGEDAYKVQVRVKVGPMSMLYRGQAEITDRNEEARTADMRVQARETRGQGTANATVKIELGEEGVGTRATMTTDLKLGGRAAAMGRGVITDVSHALVSEFADNLARMLSGAPGEGAAVQASPSGAPSGAPASGPPLPNAGAPASGPPSPNDSAPASGPPSSSTDALDAAQLAGSVIATRLREPRTLFSAGGLLALACLAVGFGLRRRAARR